LTNKVDLDNPEGHQILQNVYEPLPLGGPPGDKERKIALSISKLKAARYLDFGLEELVPSLWVESEREYDISAVYGITHCVISVKVFKKYGYNYLKEIILRRADYQEYKISEKDFNKESRSQKGILEILHPIDFDRSVSYLQYSKALHSLRQETVGQYIMLPESLRMMLTLNIDIMDPVLQSKNPPSTQNLSKDFLNQSDNRMVFHNENGNPARANIKQALGYVKDGDGDWNSQPLRYQGRLIRISDRLHCYGRL
ncbi:hypothetical protein Tco_0347900, partial [Tanacetum coccineum]